MLRERIMRPNHLACTRVQAIQNARRSLGKNFALVNRRRRARARVSHCASPTWIPPHLIRVRPNNFAGKQFAASNQLVLASLLLRNRIIAHNRKRRPTGTDFLAPQFSRRVRLPVSFEFDALDFGPKTLAEKTRIVVRRCLPIECRFHVDLWYGQFFIRRVASPAPTHYANIAVENHLHRQYS